MYEEGPSIPPATPQCVQAKGPKFKKPSQPKGCNQHIHLATYIERNTIKEPRVWEGCVLLSVGDGILGWECPCCEKGPGGRFCFGEVQGQHERCECSLLW